MKLSELNFQLDENYALNLDTQDPLADFKERFYHIPNTIYMDGNSLGLISKDSEKTLLRVLEEWKKLGINGWSNAKIPWIKYAEHLGAMEAPLVGAKADEVIVCGGTTVNLHTLVATFYKPTRKRKKILADELNFPSDIYALVSQIKLKDGNPTEDLSLVKSKDGRLIEEEDIINSIDQEVALILLPSVYYKSGQLLDMEKLTIEAHKYGIPIGFDCSHSIGVVPHYFNKWGVDFAFWCNYKYMNGGPGSTGGLYVNEHHFDLMPGLAGWFGNNKETMFDMNIEFDPAKTAAAWQIGTTTIFSTSPLEGSINMINEAGIENIRKKSLKMTSYLIRLVDEKIHASPYNFSIGTPREPYRRGGHVALEHKDAWRVCQALKARGVIPDYRPPNVIRLAPIPLYISYHEVWRVVDILKDIINKKEHEKFSIKRGIVT